MLRRLCWALAASLVCSSYSYSEEFVFGQTQNAAAAGYTWVMTNILPQVAGLQINGVVYSYTAEKKTEDDMLVHISNLRAGGTGYVFRNTDDWSKIPGNTIQRAVPVANIFAEFFGEGSIEVEGNGRVLDASVIYTFQYDPCFDPQSSPTCPGYKEPVVYSIETAEVSDPLDDEYVRKEYERKASVDDEDEKERARARASANAAEKRQSRLETALSAVNTALMTAEAAAAASDFFAVAALPDTYQAQIPGGEYRETVRLADAKLPDNPSGIRNTWAQQLLHEQMVDLQYASLETKKE